MWKHWRTTIFGALAATTYVLHGMGITIGHLGAADFVQIIGAISTLALGASAADAAKTN